VSDRDDTEPQQRPTVRDRRRIDPDTYEVREPQGTAAPAAQETAAAAAGADGPVIDEVSALRAAMAERTADLQRLQAEYVNYKRRVDRDRDRVRTLAVEAVLKDLLSALDDIRSAREHGELTGGFKAVGEEVERITAKHGLQAYGDKGDPFDPHIHEALLNAHAEGITGPTCVEILQPGYRVGERVLRPARVAVAIPAAPPEGETLAAGTGSQEQPDTEPVGVDGTPGEAERI